MNYYNFNIQEFLEDISKIVKLPKTGYLAGGAIGNYMIAKKKGLEPVINDVDIFYPEEEQSDLNTIKTDFFKKITFFDQKTEFKTPESDYQHYTYESRKLNKFYKIKDTTRKGNLNVINYNTNDTSLRFLLTTFDINCTKAGIDLRTGEFIVLDDYQDFYDNELLKVTNPHTPCHSLLRLLKKSEELNFPMDESKEIERCKRAYRVERKPVRKWFSDKYINLYQKYEDKLHDHFIIEKVDKKTHIIYTMLPKQYKDDTLLTNGTMKSYHVEGLPTPLKDVEEVNYFVDHVFGDEMKEELFFDVRKFNFRNIFDNFKEEDYKTSKPYINTLSTWIKKGAQCLPNMFKGLSLKESFTYIDWIDKMVKEKPKHFLLLQRTTSNMRDFESYQDMVDYFDLIAIRYRSFLSKRTANEGRVVKDDNNTLSTFAF